MDQEKRHHPLQMIYTCASTISIVVTEVIIIFIPHYLFITPICAVITFSVVAIPLFLFLLFMNIITTTITTSSTITTIIVITTLTFTTTTTTILHLITTRFSLVFSTIAKATKTIFKNLRPQIAINILIVV
ncbi:hypothetical protein ElyMa_003625700 [Elysia marginata]|uniref:G-protein coupled receptors family 1 profile domain-containing protein n=1 Tax=Elysia marginata TaxID=1093978 RepID=A0AAV4ESQ0_9GAST|nr:hypothetical protein ElyMa_003625700 [Elysia marginata]